jgi:hypothetical protein
MLKAMSKSFDPSLPSKAEGSDCTDISGRPDVWLLERNFRPNLKASPTSLYRWYEEEGAVRGSFGRKVGKAGCLIDDTPASMAVLHVTSCSDNRLGGRSIL